MQKGKLKISTDSHESLEPGYSYGTELFAPIKDGTEEEFIDFCREVAEEFVKRRGREDLVNKIKVFQRGTMLLLPVGLCYCVEWRVEVPKEKKN